MASENHAVPCGTRHAAGKHSEVTPQEVGEVAAHAEAKDPTIVDRVGGFYAEHPQVVKALGGIALAIALGHMANARR